MTDMWKLGKPGRGLSSSVAGKNSFEVGTARDRSKNDQTKLVLLRRSSAHFTHGSSVLHALTIGSRLSFFLLSVVQWSFSFLSYLQVTILRRENQCLH